MDKVMKILTFGQNKVPVLEFYDVTEPHISAYLSQISKMVENEALIWSSIFPRWPVVKTKDKIPVYGSEHMMRLRTERAPKTESNAATRHLGTAIEYECAAHALHDLVSQEERQNADPPIKPEIDCVEFLTDLIELQMEFMAYDLVTTTGNYGGATLYSTPTAKWDDYDNADSKPLNEINDAKKAIHDASGKMANIIMIPYTVALKLSRHPDILEEKKYVDPNLLTRGDLPPVLKGLRVVEAGGVYNSEIQGQTASLGDIWSDYVWVGYRNPRMGLKSTTWGLTFDAGGRITRQWYEQKKKADWIEVEEQGLDMKIFDNNCGYLFSDVLQ